ncbi:hypothetical protein RJ639_014502 [Escallonia herrerae]|uniref:ATPase AAA-type core domain-containing protein n=1 Tax=Escallonia herrerae TaxID=1293975 RepID=A0AA89AM22_9ASTE|nr:hypothetical protein RJ639_014502 [Escallonia herrerae]
MVGVRVSNALALSPIFDNRKVGKAWGRGYLLYGPTGRGKSSLIGAIDNFLKLDISDLQLLNVGNDSNIRELLLWTPNQSILVIEDIDCSVKLPGLVD